MTRSTPRAQDETAERTASAFAHVDCWIFDLDNTLYSFEARLFDQIDRRMTSFIAETLAVSAEEANRLRAVYWDQYGTTLNGLMSLHDTPPEAFLDYVHDIDLGALEACRHRRAALAALPGRRIVHTNGSRGHAARVLAKLGIEDLFDQVFAIEDSAYAPKPAEQAYAAVIRGAEVEPRRAAFFEDTARNLETPHRLGMRTVFTPTGCRRAEADRDQPYVEFVAEDLTGFLTRLTAPTTAHATGEAVR
ncbi:MAG: pyrimidine 5'-nucleotidase [Pseudomonadota bacterium]